jgi:methionyl aminopeptidase
MSLIKSGKEIGILREAGKRLAVMLQKVAEHALPGVSTAELNDLAWQLIIEAGDVPALLNYTPLGSSRPFPAVMCVSINDEIVHGIPNEGNKVLCAGDIVGLDLTIQHNGLFIDMAVTVGVGNIDDEADKLLKETKSALMRGIKAVRPGGHIGDIGANIEVVAKRHGYGLVRELGGHGVGHAVHELPYIPNYGKRGRGDVLKQGMVIAIEPMFTLGSPRVLLDEDGYTYRTADRKRSAHFEHTVVVTQSGVEILTVI